ncbi:MAG: alpha/beta hydrolase [Alphaproteobacteria bacterium]|nr:alpha/beta hydrolase [Alphaproteobacteria bacterium]
MIAGANFYPADAVTFSMAEQRAFYNRYCVHFRKTRPPTVETNDLRIAGVPCRRYVRQGAPAAPLLIYLHGGGFVLGGLDSHDDVCAEICDGAGIDVVAVDYRLAPEHPFPAAFEDGWAVLQELGKTHARIILGGDSAGGNLAAALALKARDAGGPALSGQVLIYPGLGGDMTKGSYVSQAEPAFLVAAGLDPLHDDCFDYARNLRDAGVPAVVRDEPLLVHAFIRARHMSTPARASFDAIIAACGALAHNGKLP